MVPAVPWTTSMPVMPSALRRVAEGSGELFGGEGDDLGAPAEALGEGYVEVLACGEGDDLIAVGEGLADGEGAVADGAGGAEDR